MGTLNYLRLGVAFQNLIGAENIGFIIPTTVIRHFLSEVMLEGMYFMVESAEKLYVKVARRGVCEFPALGIYCQPLDSPLLRDFLGLKPEHHGHGVRGFA